MKNNWRRSSAFKHISRLILEFLLLTLKKLVFLKINFVICVNCPGAVFDSPTLHPRPNKNLYSHSPNTKFRPSSL